MLLRAVGAKVVTASKSKRTWVVLPVCLISIDHVCVADCALRLAVGLINID